MLKISRNHLIDLTLMLRRHATRIPVSFFFFIVIKQESYLATGVWDRPYVRVMNKNRLNCYTHSCVFTIRSKTFIYFYFRNGSTYVDQLVLLQYQCPDTRGIRLGERKRGVTMPGTRLTSVCE